MGMHIDFDENNLNTDYNNVDDDDVDINVLAHKKDVRRKLEARLERRRLKEELEDYEGELDDEFDWDNIDRL